MTEFGTKFFSNQGAMVIFIGLLHLISLPPPLVVDLPFLITPENWLKLHSPLKTSIWAYPEEYVFTPEELCEK